MKCFLEVLPAAAILIVGTMVGQSFANDREVNDIWWNLETNYYGSQQTVCIAKNYNYYPVTAVFNTFPGADDPDGNPMPTRAVITMQPYVEYRVYSWPADYTGPGPHCELLSYSVSAQ